MKFIKFINIIITFTFIAILQSCQSGENSRLFFYNNVETSYAWNENHQSNIIKTDDAHSGRYVCKLDESGPYSVTFQMKLSDISSKPLKSVLISAWVKLSSMNANPMLIADIRENSQNTIEWIGKAAKDVVKVPNKWQLVVLKLNLEEKNRNNPDHYLRVYVGNGAKDYALVDDIKLQFADK